LESPHNNFGLVDLVCHSSFFFSLFKFKPKIRKSLNIKKKGFKQKKMEEKSENKKTDEEHH